MANEENLISFTERTESERREIARMGGIASGEARRKKKAVREVIEMIAHQPLTNEKLKKSIKAVTAGVCDEDIDMITAATMGIFQAAIKGNTSAFELIAEKLEEFDDFEEMQNDGLSESIEELKQRGAKL